MQQVRLRQKLIDFKLAAMFINAAGQTTSGPENIGGGEGLATAPIAPPVLRSLVGV